MSFASKQSVLPVPAPPEIWSTLPGAAQELLDVVVLGEDLAHAPLLCGQAFLERRLSVRERALRIVELLDERGSIRVSRRANAFGEDIRGA